jgi:heme/copper-type cytochrome/quinol oxidase subunit 4
MAEVVFSLLVPLTTVAPASVIPETGIIMGLMGVASFFGFGMVGVLDPSYGFLNASVRRDYAWMVIAIFLGLFMLVPPLLSITYWLPTYLSDTILFAYCALQGAYAIGSAYTIKLLINQG